MSSKRPLPKVASAKPKPPADDLADVKAALPPAVSRPAAAQYTAADMKKGKTSVVLPASFITEVRRQHSADPAVSMNTAVLVALYQAGWRIPERTLPIGWDEMDAGIKDRWRAAPPDVGADGNAVERPTVYLPESFRRQVRELNVARPDLKLSDIITKALADQGWPIPPTLINADAVP